MNTIKEILHKKREATEKHIKQLQQEGKQGYPLYCYDTRYSISNIGAIK